MGKFLDKKIRDPHETSNFQRLRIFQYYLKALKKPFVLAPTKASLFENEHPFISGKAVSWALLNPSVSPFRMSSGGGGSGGIRTVGNRAGSMSGEQSSNPAVRLYRYDPMTGHVSHLWQFLALTCIRQTKSYEKEYSACIGPIFNRGRTHIWRLIVL